MDPVLAKALFSALENPPSLLRSADGQAGTRKYKYVPLPEMLEILRPHFAKYGLVIMQPSRPASHPGYVSCRTLALHTSGEMFSDEGMDLPAGKEDPQGHGSAITYCRRYAMLAFLGLAQEDDDGHYASTPEPRAASIETAQRKPAAPELPSEDSGSISAAVVELAEAQGRNAEAALRWVDAQTDRPAALRRAIADAKRNGVDRAVAEQIVKRNDIVASFMEEFDATDITDTVRG